MTKKTLSKIIIKCKKTVCTWPKWKQDIVISAYSAETGKYYNNSEG